jgi:TolB protein
VYATDDGLRNMDADGSHIRAFTRGAYHQQPRWSPNARRVVFDSALDVYVVDVKTRHVRKLTHNPGPDRNAAWSPDGRFIVYLSAKVCGTCFSAEDPLELRVMRADGTGAHRLVFGRGYNEPDWAPR